MDRFLYLLLWFVLSGGDFVKKGLVFHPPAALFEHEGLEVVGVLGVAVVAPEDERRRRQIRLSRRKSLSKNVNPTINIRKRR